MKTRVKILLFALVIITVFGCSPAVRTQPEQPTVIVVPKAPGPHYVWRQGYWVWSYKTRQYVWKEGRWENGRRHTRWVDGHWVQTKRGTRYMKGHWQ